MKRYRKILLVLSAAAVILFSANLLTSAWLVDSTQEEINTFIPGTVTTTVEEEFDGETKDNVFIRNTGNIDAYIRAAVIPVWKTESGDLREQQ